MLRIKVIDEMSVEIVIRINVFLNRHISRHILIAVYL